MQSSKSFEGAVLNYVQERAWLKTTTEGYDSDANSVVERRNGKLDQCLRALLLDATGGRLYYEELWDVAMDHAHDITARKLGNKPQWKRLEGISSI